MKPKFTTELATKEWLLSDGYKKIMDTKLFAGKEDFQKIGAWRWEGIYDNKKIIMAHIFNPNQYGIDFGGFNGTIGGYTRIIDIVDHPIVSDHSLEVYNDNSIDYIFTSHTLEHVDDIKTIIKLMYDKLKIGGKIIILVPSYTKEVWRAYYAPDHLHTMMLANDDLNHYEVPENAKYEEDLIVLDILLETVGFKILIKKHVRTHCIFIYGEK